MNTHTRATPPDTALLSTCFDQNMNIIRRLNTHEHIGPTCPPHLQSSLEATATACACYRRGYSFQTVKVSHLAVTVGATGTCTALLKATACIS